LASGAEALADGVFTRAATLYIQCEALAITGLYPNPFEMTIEKLPVGVLDSSV